MSLSSSERLAMTKSRLILDKTQMRWRRERHEGRKSENHDEIKEHGPVHQISHLTHSFCVCAAQVCPHRHAFRARARSNFPWAAHTPFGVSCPCFALCDFACPTSRRAPIGTPYPADCEARVFQEPTTMVHPFASKFALRTSILLQVCYKQNM